MTGSEAVRDMNPVGPLDERRRRNVRRTTFVLALIALGIYVAFIAASVMEAQP